MVRRNSNIIPIVFAIICVVALFRAGSALALDGFSGDIGGINQCKLTGIGGTGNPYVASTSAEVMSCYVDSRGADTATVTVLDFNPGGSAVVGDVVTPMLVMPVANEGTAPSTTCISGQNGTYCVPIPVVRTTACQLTPGFTNRVMCVYQYETDGANYLTFTLKSPTLTGGATRQYWVTYSVNRRDGLTCPGYPNVGNACTERTVATSGTDTVSGSVSVSNFPATQPVSGTVAISGTPTVSVSGTPSVSISGTAAVHDSGSVAVTNFDAGGLLTRLSQTGTNNTVKIDGTNSTTTPVHDASPSAQAVSQSGAWSVGQTGAWIVGQSGAWNVGQTGTWNVNAIQSGTWNVTSAISTIFGVATAVPVKVDQTGTNNGVQVVNSPAITCTSGCSGGGGGGGTVGIDPASNTVQLATSNLDTFQSNAEWTVFAIAFLIGLLVVLAFWAIWKRPLFGRALA